MSDILLKSIHFPQLDARYIVGDDTLSTEGAAADAKETGDALALKADKTDTYTKAQVDDKVGDAKTELEEAIDDLEENKLAIDGYSELATVGNSLQLVATQHITDTEPYNYRKTGGPNDVGDRVYDTLVGGSVVWNQLIKSTLSPSAAGGVVSFADGVASFTASTKSGNVYWVARRDAGHKYLAICDIKGTTAVTDGTVCFYDYGRGKPIDVTTSWSRAACLLNPIQTTYSSYRYGVCDYRESGWDTIEVKNYMLIDLTAAVTPLIADYIYSLETATAGAGVAYFKKYFPKEYFAYCEPHFEHVQTSAKVTVGFNQFDEDFESGDINNSGAPYANADYKRSKNFSDCLPNTVYYKYCATRLWMFFYDSEQNFIEKSSASNNTTVTTPSNARYFKVVVDKNAGEACINLHGDRDGEYEPYRKRTYPLDSSLTLRGIPKLDSANRLYYDGDIYRHDGTVERRVAYSEFDGSQDEPWELIGSSVRNIFRINTLVPNKAGADFITNGMTVSATSESASADDNIITCRTTSYISKYLYVFTPPSMIADISAFRSWLASNPLKMVYPINEPTTETAEPFQSPMVVDPLGMEEFVDYAVEQGDRDVAIPVGHTSKYPPDLRGKLQHLPSLASADGRYVVVQTGNQMTLSPDTSLGLIAALEARVAALEGGNG